MPPVATEPTTATDLLRVACRQPIEVLVAVLGLAYGDSYEPGSCFCCPRCRRLAAYSPAPWRWTCGAGCPPGTLVDLAFEVARDPHAMGRLLRDASDPGVR